MTHSGFPNLLELKIVFPLLGYSNSKISIQGGKNLPSMAKHEKRGFPYSSRYDYKHIRNPHHCLRKEEDPRVNSELLLAIRTADLQCKGRKMWRSILPVLPLTSCESLAKETISQSTDFLIL